jgi:GNAT superfamily N-acetyltransferase
MQDETDLQLIAADRVSLGQRVAIMNAAYADYYIPIRVTQEQLALMDEFYDVIPGRSVVARTRWECVGQALLALRDRRAWISGVGVVPAWRRKGMARAMMKHLLSEAILAGADEAVLEVIDRNRPARALYLSLGMNERRELLTWQRAADADALPIPQERLRAVPASELLGFFKPWHEQPASWQRDERTLRRMAGRLAGYRLDLRGKPAGYCLVAAADDNISIVDIAINPEAGLLMPGRILVQALSARYLGHALSIINVPADDSLNRILAGLGFIVTLRQIEMTKEL